MASIQGIYIALFGRPADPAGLAEFNKQTNNGQNLQAIGSLAGTEEYQGRFEGLSNAEIITAIYQELFGRNPELAGLNYYQAILDQNPYAINTIAIQILDGARNEDLELLNAKIAAADQFTAAVAADPDALAAYRGDPGIAFGKAFLDQIDSADDELTDEQVVEFIDEYLGEGSTGTTFTLTEDIDAPGITGPGIDTSGTDNNDTFLANSRSLNPGDVIDGGSGDDLARLTLGGNAIIADDLNDALNSTGIETVEIQALPINILGFPIAGNVTLDMLQAEGVTTIRNFNSGANLYVDNVQNNVAIEVVSIDDAATQIEFDDDALGSEDAVLEVSLTDSDTFLGLYTNGDDSVETVNFAVENDNFVTFDLSDDTEDELTSISASGNGFLNIIDNSINDTDAEFENVTDVDFSELAGGSFLDLSTNEVDVTYSGGEGIDFVGFGEDEFDATDEVDGGDESDFLGVDLDDADLIGGDNISNFENVILGGVLDADVTIEDTEDLDFESISIAGTADAGATLTIEEADGVVINYVGNSIFAPFDNGFTNYNLFNGEIAFVGTDDVQFVVGVNEDSEINPATGISFFAEKFEADFADEDDSFFDIAEVNISGVENIELELNGDLYINQVSIDVGFEDLLETFTITGESDFILGGGDDEFDGVTFDLTGTTGGFSNSGVGPSGEQTFILADLGTADDAFTNAADPITVDGEFNQYDFDPTSASDADADFEAGSIIALGGDAGDGDGFSDVIDFTTDGFGNIAVEGFELDSGDGIYDILDLSALVDNPGAELTIEDNEAGTGVTITSDAFEGTILLVGVFEADINGLTNPNQIFGF